MARTVDVLDASRMTAGTSRETSLRVSKYFGDAGPFSYGGVRRMTAVLLEGTMPYSVAVAGLERIKFGLARKCNLDVAKLISECDQFRGRTFYRLKKLLYPVDRDFTLTVRPEAVAVINGVPNLIFLQPRRNATPWAYSISFIRKVIDEIYQDYFEEYRVWLIDTEALGDDDREMRLIDLQAVAPMSDREFRRRMASLRSAWRLYLTSPRTRKERPSRDEDNKQTGFDFED